MSLLEDKELKSDVKRILFYLENDDRTGKSGLIKEVTQLKNDLEDMNRKMVSFITEYRQAQAVKQRDTKWLVVIWSAVSTGVIFAAKAIVGIWIK